MTAYREELAARALRLRTGGEGMSVPAVARELGISAQYAHELLSDPTGEAARRRRRKYWRENARTPCEKCGEPAWGRLCWYCADRPDPTPTLRESTRKSERARAQYDADPQHPFKRGRLALKPKPRSKVTPARLARRQRVQALWLAGRSIEEIADELGATYSAIGNLMHKMRREGWALPYRNPPRRKAPK